MSEETQKLTPAEVQEVIEEFAEKAVNSLATSYMDSITIHCHGYAEPGYTDPESGIICTGNWNTVRGRNGEPDENTPADLAKELDGMSVGIEWLDEWTACSKCEKLVRTVEDSYTWQRAYAVIEDEDVCHLCIEEDPEEYLQSLEGQDHRCNTIESIDPEQHGYVLAESGYENGFHPGQDADPAKIGKALRDQGVSRYLFNLDAKGQFDIRFSAWVHKEEYHLLDKQKLDEAETDMEVSPHKAAKEGLEKLRHVEPVEGHVVASYIDLSDGSVSSELIPREQFIKEGLRHPDKPNIVEE